MDETKQSDLTVSSFCIQNIFFACKAFSIIFGFFVEKIERNKQLRGSTCAELVVIDMQMFCFSVEKFIISYLMMHESRD